MGRVNVGAVASSVLLWLGVALELLCCLGVLAMGTVYARLHFTAPAGLGAIAIALAVLVREGFSLIGDKALLVAFVVVVAAPVVSHAIARAAWIRGGRERP
jgi:multicomponent Na+:H+ antiporter subunit G